MELVADIVRNNTQDTESEIRWKVVKAILDDFPNVRQKAKQYLAAK
jgi:hypothetical protein